MTTLTTRPFASGAALDSALEALLGAALSAPGPSAVMLAGGTTPLRAYRVLGERSPPHDPGLHILFSDDRYVPADSPESNFYQTGALLAGLALAPGTLVRVRTELPLEQAAADYEHQLAGLLGRNITIRLGLLGLGADGHTASLFSAADLERARGHLAIAVQRPDGMAGVSVTPDLLARIGELVFVVSGSGKQKAIRALMAQEAGLTAWAAVQGCAGVQLWVHEGP